MHPGWNRTLKKLQLSCTFDVFFVFSLRSCFGRLESVAAWVVAGDRAQLGLTVIRGEFRETAPELQCWIVTSPAEWYQDSDLMVSCASFDCISLVFWPVSNDTTFPWEEFLSSGLRTFCSGTYPCEQYHRKPLTHTSSVPCSIIPNIHDFGQWDEAIIQERYSCGHGENMGTLHHKDSFAVRHQH